MTIKYMTCLCIMLHLLYIIVSIWCTCVKNTVITSCMYINMYDCMFVDDEGCNSFVENVCSHVQYACSVDNFRSVVITKKLMLRLQKLKQCTCTQHMYTLISAYNLLVEQLLYIATIQTR